ncbi:MAG: hypothetical protein ACYCPS_05585 [Candidatus Saccharimonadales bacterium]
MIGPEFLYQAWMTLALCLDQSHFFSFDWEFLYLPVRSDVNTFRKNTSVGYSQLKQRRTFFITTIRMELKLRQPVEMLLLT